MVLALALVLTPLALLARPSLHSSSKCNGICCPIQKSHHNPAASAAKQSDAESAHCHRGIVAQIGMCIAPPGSNEDRIALAPLPPAILLEINAMARTQFEEASWLAGFDSVRAGFASLPFQPPRT
jgi:hypothetical protein